MTDIQNDILTQRIFQASRSGVPHGFMATENVVVVYGSESSIQNNYGTLEFALAAYPNLKLLSLTHTDPT